MGFRSTFVTQHYYVNWPSWFVEKYNVTVLFGFNNSGSISSAFECKHNETWSNLHTDIQSAIDWKDFPDSFILIYLHECGGITRCQIEEKRIIWSEPKTWLIEESVTHYYCYGCSDIS